MLGLEYDRNMSTRLAKAYFRVASAMGLGAGLLKCLFSIFTEEKNAATKAYMR